MCSISLELKNLRDIILDNTNIKIIGNSKSEIVGIDTFTVIPLNQKPYYEQFGLGEILLYENDKLESSSLNWKNEDIVKIIDSKFDRILHN